jgi:hydrogenase maturation protease
VTNARPRRILIGVGNPDRGDDAAGRTMARCLVGALPEDVEIAELDGEATALVARLQGADAAILVDACASGAPAGTVRRFDVGEAPLPQGTFGVSTHGFGLAEAIELARALGDLPASCIVYAIEGASFEAGAPLTPPVAAAIEEVAGRLCAEFAGLGQSEGPEPCTKPR